MRLHRAIKLGIAGGIIAAACATALSAQSNYTPVIISLGCYPPSIKLANGTCITNPTPEQRRENEERIRSEKEEQQRLERERQLRNAERNRRVNEQLARLGPNRRAEAERFVDMQLAAEEAKKRSGSPLRPATTPPPKPSPSPSATPGKSECKRREMRRTFDASKGQYVMKSVCLDASKVWPQ